MSFVSRSLHAPLKTRSLALERSIDALPNHELRPGFESGGIAVVATKSRGPRQGAARWKETLSVLLLSS